MSKLSRTHERPSAGEAYDPGDPSWEITKAMQVAAGADAQVMRAFFRIMSLVWTPNDLITQPGLLDAIIEKGGAWRDAPPTGPTRAELLALVGA